jgi:hypothetical protein
LCDFLGNFSAGSDIPMATGDSLLVLDPLSNRPPAANFASVDLRGEFVVLDFDDTTNEQAQFYAIVPSHYRGGDLEAMLTWTSSSATSGDAKFKCELTRLEAGTNLDALPSPDGSDEVTLAAPTTSGDLVVDLTDPITVSGLTSGETLRVQVTRLATDVGDTLVGDVEIAAIELKEV